MRISVAEADTTCCLGGVLALRFNGQILERSNGKGAVPLADIGGGIACRSVVELVQAAS